MKSLLIGIVGSRNTGKTTFTCVCSKLLSEVGKSVLVIKFSSSYYSIDPESKDSALFRISNVNKVIFSSPYETVAYTKVKNRSNLDELLKLVPENVDIILCESYPATFPNIPLIFVTKNIKDYKETKIRYNNQEPICVIKSPSTENEDHFRTLNTFLMERMEDRKAVIDKIILLTK